MFIFNSENLQILLRLVVSVLLGGIIGFERAEKNHDAGLRTHILVCLGAATVMLVSQFLVIEYDAKSEIMRMGAQVISGIGFLGIGSIIISGDRIKGLTTAAGLWTTACVGLAVGVGQYFIAVVAVSLMMFAMLGLRPLSSRIQSKSMEMTLCIGLENKMIIENTLKNVNDLGVIINSVKIDEKSPDDTISIILKIRLRKISDRKYLIGKISAFQGINEVSLL
jgi:putative Mg2+ transporter-C (MgtC) family protein